MKIMDRQNVLKDRILSSSDNESWSPSIPLGSYYQAILADVHKYLDEHGDWILLKNCITKEVFWASQFEPLAKKFSLIFSRLGLDYGGTIHLVIGNHNYTFSACAGAWILGARVSCGDIALDSKAIAGQLDDTDASIVIVTPSTAKIVLKAVKFVRKNRQNNNSNNNNGSSNNKKDRHKKKDDLIYVLCLGVADGCLNIFDLLEHTNVEEAPDAVDAEDIKKDVAIIFWSSGTTGLPKGICHSHFSAYNWFGSLQTLMRPHTSMVTTTCFFHVGGFFAGINAMRSHQTDFHILGPGFSLSLLMDTIREVKPRGVALGTHHYVQLSESKILKEVNPEDLSEVKLLMPAGAAVPSSCEQAIRKTFKNLQAVLNGYGQTESGAISLGTTPYKLGTVLPGVKIKIEDPDTSTRCGPGQLGEICVKNSYLMAGYLKRPQETKDYFDFEGFGHTGDLGYYDKNGDFYFVDRMKELIKYQNNHIAPTEIEEILQSHPAVQECLVFGKKDDRVQELVTAVVVLKPDQEKKISENDLVEYVNGQVEIDFKKIRGGIIFRNEIPRNNVGKLLRREMRDWAAKLS